MAEKSFTSVAEAALFPTSTGNHSRPGKAIWDQRTNLSEAADEEPGRIPTGATEDSSCDEKEDVDLVSFSLYIYRSSADAAGGHLGRTKRSRKSKELEPSEEMGSMSNNRSQICCLPSSPRP